MADNKTEDQISFRARNKIIYKLGALADTECHELIHAYNECIKGRTVSILWACRDVYTKSQDCMHKYVNQKNVETIQERWVAAGKPIKPDWNEMLDGIAPKRAAGS